MDAKDAIRSSANLSSMVLQSYISDLDDADLMRRPGKDCNHLAWQLGHLIASEVHLLASIVPDAAAGSGVELPDGFAAAHSKENHENDDPAAFQTKQQYEELWQRVRSATLKALENCSAADLDQPAPEHFRNFCPTVGDMFVLIATHPMMHAGQFVIVRRQLGKPILM